MPTITFIGTTFVLFGVILIAFTPKERNVQVTSAPQWGTSIAVINSTGTEAAGAMVPYAENGKVLAWDDGKKIYRWVPAPSAHQ